ncbi:cupredoxin family copper-binding protein [soil metagenome]
MLLIKTLKQPDRSRLTSAYSLFLMIIIAAGLALGGCGDETIGPDIDDENDINDDRNGPEVVRMVGQSFSPSNLQVVAGTTVAWENDSDLVHTVTSGSDREHDEKFNSGDIAPGESYSYTFTETGTFPYFCIPHPGMQGTVTVVEGHNDDGY